MSFLDQLNQEINKLESNSGGDFDDVVHPSSTLKHDQLIFSAENTEYLVRVLPPKDENSFFAVGFQRMFFDVTNLSGKRINSPMILPLKGDPENNLLDRKVQEWVQNKNMPGMYPSTRPQTRYYVNVIRLNPLGGKQYEHEMNPDGTPVIRVMELPRTAYQGILTDLADDMIPDPEGSGDYGAISANNAYPIRVHRTGQKLDTKYHVRTYEHPLGPLPQGWENELPDLNYLATPSEAYNEEFVQYMIAIHEGREEEFNSGRGQGGDSNAGSNQPQQNQGFNQQQGNTFNQQGATISNEDFSHLPPKQNQQQQPEQGGFNQPQQQQQVQQPQQGGFNQPQQQQGGGGINQQPQQPQQQQQNQQNQGFNQQQQPQQQTQPQQQGGFSQPQQQQQPDNTQDTGGFETPSPGSVPSIDDLLSQVKGEAGQ